MSYRSFQQDMLRTAQRITAGDSPRLIVLNAYPGSGKSVAPVILATELIGKTVNGRRIDHLCWVVPRRSLQEQAMDAFLDQKWRDLLGHEFRIRKSTNDVQPSRNLAGHVTTYQAVAADSAGQLAQEFARHNYILCLDEPHHILEGNEYDIALRPLVARAAVVLLMSGTLYRASQHEAIAFLPYTRQGNVRKPIDASNDRAVYIKYTLDEAIHEKALKHIEFELLDTSAEWRDRPGAPLTGVDSLQGLDRDVSSNALFTALRTDFAEQLLKQALDHWNGYRARYKRSKLLVVAASQRLARSYLTKLKGMGVARVEIATSDDSDQAQVNIDRFKLAPDDPKALDVLVTVAMAYEGLDVPSITHLAVLTHIRSVGWITQMLARGQRVDWKDGRSPRAQRGFVFAPRDPFFDDIVAMLKAAQERGDVEDPDVINGPTGPGGTPWEPIIPEGSDRNEQDVAVDTADQSLTVERLAYVRDLMVRHGLQGMSAVELDAVLRDDEAARAARSAAAAQSEADVAAESARVARATAARRPNDEEDELRRAINDIATRRDSELGVPFGTTNGALLTKFRKPRPAMNIDELRQVYQYLVRNHGATDAAD